MSSFTDPLKDQYVGYGVYKILSPFRFYLSDTKTGDYIEVPVDFYTNYASIPIFIQWLFHWKPNSLYGRKPLQSMMV